MQTGSPGETMSYLSIVVVVGVFPLVTVSYCVSFPFSLFCILFVSILGGRRAAFAVVARTRHFERQKGERYSAEYDLQEMAKELYNVPESRGTKNWSLRLTSGDLINLI